MAEPAYIRIARDTDANWDAGRVPFAGEPTYETDTKLFRIGDGTTAQNGLDAAAFVDGHTNLFGPDIMSALDGRYPSKSGSSTFGGNNRFTGPIGFGTAGGSNPRQPFNSVQTIDAAASGSTDKVAHSLTTNAVGDFSQGTGSNPSFAWGINAFLNTGTAALDGNGANLQNLIETNVGAASGTVASAIGLIAQASFFGAAAGATVTNMMSLRVEPPVRKDGATAGTATNAYSLYVAQPGNVGATSSFSVFVEGGISRFGGRVDVTNTIANNGAANLSLFAGYSAADGGALILGKAASGGHATANLVTAGAKLKVYNGSADVITLGNDGAVVTTAQSANVVPLTLNAAASTTTDVLRVVSAGASVFKVDSGGTARSTVGFLLRNGADSANIAGLTGSGLRYYTSSLEQATVGGAGSAAAPPASPTKYFKVQDSNGTTLLIPAYAAS